MVFFLVKGKRSPIQRGLGAVERGDFANGVGDDDDYAPHNKTATTMDRRTHGRTGDVVMLRGYCCKLAFVFFFLFLLFLYYNYFSFFVVVVVAFFYKDFCYLH